MKFVINRSPVVNVTGSIVGYFNISAVGKIIRRVDCTHLSSRHCCWWWVGKLTCHPFISWSFLMSASAGVCCQKALPCGDSWRHRTANGDTTPAISGGLLTATATPPRSSASEFADRPPVRTQTHLFFQSKFRFSITGTASLSVGGKANSSSSSSWKSNIRRESDYGSGDERHRSLSGLRQPRPGWR